MKGQEIIICPNCGGNKVKVNPILKYGLIGGFLFCLIPIIGWITGPLLLIVTLAGFLIGKTKKIKPMICVECKHKFQSSEDTFKKYQEYLR